MKFVMRYIFKVIYWPVLVVLSVLHFPRFIGRKNIPEGPALICANHPGLADPVWAVLAMKDRKIPWIMAKKQIMDTPVLGRFLSWFGAFGVDRDAADINAIKRALKHLRDGDKLLIFPEGTRVKKGKTVTPKSGALMIANRAGVPVVPLYITHHRKPFQPIKCVFGTPYLPELGKRPSAEELEKASAELMQTIYGLAEVRK